MLCISQNDSTSNPTSSTSSSSILITNQSLPNSPVCNTDASVCRPGVLLPVWKPLYNLGIGDTVARAIVYALSLAYLFLGVSIISDRFMSSIEVITSQEKQISVVDSEGNTQTVMIKYWNETVSNLTLMALGSSAPEILLSVIEIFGNDFESGDLGPNTIVGSAAYNLFVIIGYCILVVPKNEVRRIKCVRVFALTSSMSIFAYVWLYLIIAFISPNVIDLWEALVTLAFFPLTVICAYVLDTKMGGLGKYLQKRNVTARLSTSHHRTDEEIGEVGQPLKLTNGEANDPQNLSNDKLDVVITNNANPDIKHFEDHRKEYINILREMRQKHPDIGIDELQKLAEVEILKRGPKSRAYYRIQATRKLVGGNTNVKKKVENKDRLLKEKSKSNLANVLETIEDPNLTMISFEPSHYTCFESVGSLEVYVSRRGGDLSKTVLVDYHTEDGTAERDTDYIYTEGTLTFYAGETRKNFVVNIIDDDVYEEDEHFNCRIKNARYKENNLVDERTLKCVYPDIATVMILDDDHGGVFIFSEPKIEIIEDIGMLRVKVIRTSGARGKVKVPYKTVNGTAIGGKDFEKKSDVLTFYNNEIEKYIEVDIVDDEDYQKNEHFFIELEEPWTEFHGKRKGEGAEDAEGNTDYNEAGKPRLGEVCKLEIHIKESKAFKGIVDNLLTSGNGNALLVGTSSWREQFTDAFRVNAEDDDEDDDSGDKEGEGENDDDKKKEKSPKEPNHPSAVDYIMHYISLFWKVLFAFVPPTDYFGGWACFIVSIVMIGVLTAVIGDLASHFGCTIGLKDSVTAISFVALGTSLPDTFASKVAAIQDKYADGSVGNVTGSNAVNVFLGIGLAWTAAALYHWKNGTQFVVSAGSLGFSTVTFCTFACVAIALMMIRRIPQIGGELGGPTTSRIITSGLFFSLWIGYITLSSLETYCIIPGF